MADNTEQGEKSTHPTSTAWKIIPHLRSSDIDTTMSFYTKHLHFEEGSVHHENTPKPTFCSIAIGDKAAVVLFFYLSEEETQSTKGTTVHIAMRNPALEELYGLIQQQNAKAEAKTANDTGEEFRKITIVSPIEDKPWGFKEFTIEDPDRNELVFFRFLEGE